MAPLNFKFSIVKNMDKLVNEITSGIERIHPSAYSLVWYWHTKYANEINLTPKPLDERDSYERQDNLNLLGVAVLFIRKLNA